MKESFESFEGEERGTIEDLQGPRDIDLDAVDAKLAEARGNKMEGSFPSSEYDDALLMEGGYKATISELKEKIKEAEQKNDETGVLALEGQLRDIEQKLTETKEVIQEKETKRQEYNRSKTLVVNSEAAHEAAFIENEKRKRHSEALVEEGEREEQMVRGTEMRDDMEARIEAEDQERDHDRETYKENVASAKRSLAFYARDPQRILQQKRLVDSLGVQNPEIQRLREEIQNAEKKDGPDVHNEVNRLEALLREAEKSPSPRATEEAVLANMEKIFPARDADAEKFVQRYLGGSLEEHEVARMEFASEVKVVDNIEGLLNIVSEWGAIPEGNKFLTNTKFREDFDEIMSLKDENEKIAKLEKITKNDEVCEKLLALYRKEYDALTPVEEEIEPSIPVEVHSHKPPHEPRRSMNQPNIEPKKEWKPTGSPEMIAELQKAKDNEKELQTLSSMISTDRFRLFPAALLATKKGRKALEMLEDMHAPMDSKYLRETSVPIAVSLRLKVARQLRENLEEQLGRDIRDSDRRVNAITEYPAGPIVIPDGNYRRPSASREQKEHNEDRQGTWLSRLFSRSPKVPKKLNASDEKPRRPYRRTFNRKDEGSF